MHTPPLSVITSNDHRSHDPEFDIYYGSMVRRFEVPQPQVRIAPGGQHKTEGVRCPATLQEALIAPVER